MKRAEEFVRVLLAATPAPVCEDIGMCVLKDIPDIENQFAKLDIILRESTLPFWRECIRLTDFGHRVWQVDHDGGAHQGIARGRQDRRLPQAT